MTLIAVPNVSEGRNRPTIARLSEEIEDAGARVLDRHTDGVHNRSVFTVTAEAGALSSAMVRLARTSAETIDLTVHEGVHPRIGVLDVCPFVPHDRPMADAVETAVTTGREIGRGGLPVVLYGEAARRPGRRHLPTIRRGGLESWMEADPTDSVDFGPEVIDPRTGIVCVGARGPLIAFNVNIDAPVDVARRIAQWVRDEERGPIGVRALGLEMPNGSQVSMNLTDPMAAGIDRAFSEVETAAHGLDASVVGTEIVGLVEERFLPDPNAKAARLLVEPGRSLEAALLS